MGRPRAERYAKLKAGFWSHRKTRSTSNEALGVLVRAWSYCVDQTTDGVVPLEMLAAWSGKRWATIRKELVGRGWIVEVDDLDARCHDFLDHNISAAGYEEYLEGEKDRKRSKNSAPIRKVSGGNSPAILRHSEPRSDDDDDDDLSLTRESRTRSRDPELGRLAETIRRGVVEGFEAIEQPAPRETTNLTWPGWVQLARWVRDKARLTKADEVETAKRTVRAFLRSTKAKRDGWPITFLVQNPAEYVAESEAAA